MKTYYAFTARAVLAGLSLVLMLAAPASAANLRFERETRKDDDGRQLESINRVFDFDDATVLRLKTTQVSGSNELYSRKWGDYFFGLDFGRNGNGGWDIWDFLQVHSLENKKPVAYIRQRLPDSVSSLSSLDRFSPNVAGAAQTATAACANQIRPAEILFFRSCWKALAGNRRPDAVSLSRQY